MSFQLQKQLFLSDIRDEQYGVKKVKYGELSDVTRMLLDQLQSLPEYKLFRWLAVLKERKAQGQVIFAP